jgi:hypothetical protein
MKTFSDFYSDIQNMKTPAGEASEHSEGQIEEKWSDKRKRTIDCDRPRGFSERASCQGREKRKREREQRRRRFARLY